MNVVGGADVYGGDFWVGGDFFDAGVGAFETESFGGGGAASAGADESSFDADRNSAQRFDVGFADESGSNDGGYVVHSVEFSHKAGSVARAKLHRPKSVLARGGILRQDSAYRYSLPARRALRTWASSFFLSSSTSGNCRSSVWSFSMMAPATARRVNHLLSAGMTYQGACLVAVFWII